MASIDENPRHYVDMESIDEMMSHKNKDPKWMTESDGKGNNNNNNSKSNNKNDVKDSSTPSKPKAPSVPKTEFKVKMCCEKCEEKAKEEAGEVDGVVSVTTDKSKSKVTVTGYADAAAVLKKLKKHVNRKASYWPVDSNPKTQVAFKEDNSSELGDSSKGGSNKGPKLGGDKGGKLGGEKGKTKLGSNKYDQKSSEKGGSNNDKLYERSSEINNNMEELGETKKGNNKKGSNSDKDFQAGCKEQGARPNGYNMLPADPRDFRGVDPWTAAAGGGVAGGGGGGGGGGYGPQYYESHVDPRDLMRAGDYQATPFYFSNYRPSQSYYPANYSYTDEYSN